MGGTMFGFIKTLVGGAAYASDPIKTGSTYIAQKVKQELGSSGRYPTDLYKDLAAHAYEYAKMMRPYKPGEALVTLFTEHLDLVVWTLCDIAEGKSPLSSDQILKIIERYNIQTYRAQTSTIEK